MVVEWGHRKGRWKGGRVSISFGSRSPKYTNRWIYVMLEEGKSKTISRFLTDGASRRTGFRVHVGGWNEFCLRHDELKSFQSCTEDVHLGVLSTDGEFKAMGGRWDYPGTGWKQGSTKWMRKMKMHWPARPNRKWKKEGEFDDEGKSRGDWRCVSPWENDKGIIILKSLFFLLVFMWDYLKKHFSWC